MAHQERSEFNWKIDRDSLKLFNTTAVIRVCIRTGVLCALKELTSCINFAGVDAVSITRILFQTKLQKI